MKKLALIVLILTPFFVQAQDSVDYGHYFSKKVYDGKELPAYSLSKDRIPKPILQENQEWLDMYWKCWELAFDHFKLPPQNSPFVSNILDEAFNDCIFQWDMIFMVMFARYTDHIFPAVESLDNFYCRQHPSGYICREINEIDGSDAVFMGRVNTINPPLFSWAEIESSHNTGDVSRFEMILPVLEKYVEWLNKDGSPELANDDDNYYKYGRRSVNSLHQLYWNTPLGSGMDNTPRGGNGWVDMSCQMVIQYNNLATICKTLEKPDKASFYESEAKKLKDRINQFCWNEEDGLYYDVDHEGKQIKWKTSGCFWPLIAKVASEEQSQRLVSHLQDTNSFWRKNVFPTLAADQEHYDEMGGYWLGGVWAPTNYMIIKGLEEYGYEDFATLATTKYLNTMQCVFDSTQTVWENYSPEFCKPGSPSKPDFVGWTGIGPISLLIENILGFRVDALNKALTWRISRLDEHGIKNLKIGKSTISLICQKREHDSSPVQIIIDSDSEINLTLQINGTEKYFIIKKGHTIIKL